MKSFFKLLLLIIAVAGMVLIVRHGSRAEHASLPQDMPRNASFLPSGFDLQQNEAKGTWVACHADQQEDTDWCRLTDAKGTVVYQGAFMPISAGTPLPDDQLRVATLSKGQSWVNGPAAGGPVPVISLANGALLVPADDRDALLDRWNSNPQELQQIQSE